jgi:methylthioribulose-1-phosphate dehydratase
MFTPHERQLAEELVQAIHFFSAQGWSPATSTNYSVRSDKPDEVIISRSGVDKSRFDLTDLIKINFAGEISPSFAGATIKSSAETEIHTHLYQLFPEINCVMHTHSVLGTVLSLQLAPEKQIRFEGYELLKGLEDNLTHELVELLPIVPNSQEIPQILRSMDRHLQAPLKIHGFLIEGHGLYTWGKNIAAAKRHVETFEFLFQCTHAMGRN